MSEKLIKWNSMDQEPDQEIDDSMIPADPPGYVPIGPEQTYTDDTYMAQLVEEVSDDEEQEEQDDAVILGNARLRLETGRLYEMLYATDIFGNLDADPQAIKNVQRELKRFAKERMEVMLGMKKPVEEQVGSYAQFNSLEVEILKTLAKKLSGGTTDQGGPQPAPKNTTLTPISSGAGKTSKAAVKSVVNAKLNPAKTPAKTPAPVPEGVSSELANKKIEDMTYDEKLEYNRQKSALYNAKKVANPEAIPMPDASGMNALAAMRAGNTASNVAAAMLRR